MPLIQSRALEPMAQMESQAAWASLLQSLYQETVGRSVGAVLSQPTRAAKDALASVPVCSAASRTISVDAVWPWEGLVGSFHPPGVQVKMERLGVKLSCFEEERTSAEAIVATIHMARGTLTHFQCSTDNTLHIKVIGDSTFGEVTDISVSGITAHMSTHLDAICTVLDSCSSCAAGHKTVQSALAIDFSAGPAAHGTKQVMFGVCSGQKRQEGISERVGQYFPLEVHPFGADKVRLMREVNAYVALAEAEVRIREPAKYAKMARLRQILSRHAVFNQDATSMQSSIWTNGYVSLGARHIGRHTDYRNPAITHLTTRQEGDWTGAILTGQTVITDRFGTQAWIVEDSPKGLQWIGGLHGVAHANFGPEL